MTSINRGDFAFTTKPIFNVECRCSPMSLLILVFLFSDSAVCSLHKQRSSRPFHGNRKVEKESGAEEAGEAIYRKSFYQLFVLEGPTCRYLVTTAKILSIRNKNAQHNEYQLKIKETQVSVLGN